MLRSILPALAAVAALALGAPAAGADPVMFETPSHNIACAAFGGLLRCDMRALGNAPAPKPGWCRFDYGSSFGVTRNASKGRRLCVSDAVGGPGTAVVGYGRVWRRSGFTCRVLQTNVRCTNRRGHGFDLRKGRQRLF